jgi:8-amino-7-oxononanoate synthase
MPPPTGAALDAALAAALTSRAQRGTLRTLPPAEPRPGAALVDFTSNDYLSLSSSPTLRAAFLRGGGGGPPPASRLLVPGGAHAALEARLGAFFGAPALLMNAGYDANAALFGAVPQPGDVLLADALVHASVHDGARAGRAAWDARTHVFAHNDVSSLEALCTRMKTRYPALVDGSASAFVAVEAVYSMDGTLAPLPEIVAALARAFPARNAHLVVDEAHASGVYGPRGAGLVAAYGLENQVFARLCTFGKALAGSGGPSRSLPHRACADVGGQRCCWCRSA